MNLYVYAKGENAVAILVSYKSKQQSTLDVLSIKLSEPKTKKPLQRKPEKKEALSRK